MIKLIATDLDGTLLNDHKELDPSFFSLHKKLTDKNIKFIAASGRQYFNIFKYFETLESNIIIVAENGSIVMENGKELFSFVLKKEEILPIIETGREIKNSNLILCGKKSAYIENTDKDFVKQVETYYKEYQVVNDLTTVDDEILKITFCDLTGAEKNSLPKLKKYENNFKVALSGEIWIDITDKSGNKGNSLKKLQEMFNIKKEETMVFGDYLNDYEMLLEADYSYAMENAHEELKKIAKYNGGDNNSCGVIKSINKFLEENSL